MYYVHAYFLSVPLYLVGSHNDETNILAAAGIKNWGESTSQDHSLKQEVLSVRVRWYTSSENQNLFAASSRVVTGIRYLPCSILPLILIG